MTRKHFLLVSDFDQTLSFNDSGHVLSEMLGISTFGEKVAGLSQLNLVQSGAELAYLLLHDPEFRRVRRAMLAMWRASDAAIVSPSQRFTCSITWMSELPSPT